MNVYDIAKLAGVSSATVSRVINEKKNVREETRIRVQKIIEENNFIPNEQARNLSSKSSKLAGLMVPDVSNPFFQKLIHSITDKSESYGYHTVLYNTCEDISKQHEFLKSVTSQRLSSLIITPIFFHDEKTSSLIKYLKDNQIPVVLIDRDIQNTEVDGIFSNDYQGSFEAVQNLVKSGHKNIATISGPLSSNPGKQRYEGYKDAIEKNNINLNKDYVKNGDFMVEKAYNLTEELLTMKNPPSAIFCANNLSTIGCIKYLFENNIKIGKDICLLGFDEVDYLNYAGLNISTVERPVEKMAVEAVNLLMKRLNEKEKNYSPEKIVFNTNLILRGSEKMQI